jgi:butyryl-CoA dehydrogenase
MLLNEDLRLLRDTLRDFSRRELLPNAAQWSKHKTFPKHALKQLADMGCYGIAVPTEYGGAGLNYMALAIALEEIAAGDGGVSTVISVTNCPVNAIMMQYGTTYQKNTWLAPLARGDMLGAFCLTEPQVGSDASAITTKAQRVGDTYVINGVKQFITSGKYADIAIVIAKTDASAGKRGISAFLVPTNTPGYVVARLEDKLGQHTSDTAQIVFENCTIPIANRIGDEGDGYKIALSSLEGGRIGIASQALGMARAALEAAIDYAKQRETFGQAIFNHQAVQFRLADMATHVEVARQMIWHAASLRDAGLPCLKEAAMAKLFATEMAEKVCSDAIQIHGGYGYLSDFAVERIYRDVRVCQIYEGTSDVQRILIGRALDREHSSGHGA